ncbi:MAG TPA: phage/plasmid primase, P4 family [Nitrososphaeraceae archaeon]|nr:phage/plasmid primase, P4 family [Nitrososphaeraceae archaeon]
MNAAEENGNGADYIIQLELIPKLSQTGIVQSFVFNTKGNSVILSLSHIYDQKTVICPINYRQWTRCVDNFIKQLKRKGIAKEHIDYICDTLDSNYEKILASAYDKEHESEEEQKERIEDILMQMYYFKTMSDTCEIYYYDESKGIYVSGAEIIIESQAELMTGGTVSTSIVNEAMNHIRRRTYKSRAEFDDSEPHIINLQNGLLNTDTLELKDHSPDQLSLVQLPIKYDPKARCPAIAKFLGQVLYWEDVFTALEIIGYCLYKTAEYEKAVMLAGSGSNGKSVFLKLIEALVGSENTSHIALQDLDRDRFAAAGLYCKMVNTFADLKQVKLTSSGNFKMLVSGDSIRAQNKFKDPFSFRNYAKLIFSANKIPESEDQTYAYYRRWLILEFEKVFDEADRDTKLIDKLTVPEELSGLLNLALIALRKLRNDNGFKDISVEKIRKKYEEKSNTVKAFLDSNCIIDISDPLCDVLTTDMYAAYCKFCKDNNERSVDISVFGKQLAQFGIERKQIKRQGDKSYYYIGAKLRYDFRAAGNNGGIKKNETLA